MKIFKLLSLVLIFILIFTSCKQNSEEEVTTTAVDVTEMTEDDANSPENKIEMQDGSFIYIPRLWLNYELDGQTLSTNGTTSKVSWEKKKAGSDETEVYSSIGYNVLTASEMFSKISIAGESIKIALEFTRKPESFVIKRWKTEYINKTDMLEAFETIEIESLELEADVNYIYEIEGEWADGRASFLFVVSQN